VFFKNENEGTFEDDFGEESRGQKMLIRLKEYSIRSVIYN
jgi:hypothetical protein